MQKLIRELLAALGEDPDRPGLRATPERVEDSWRFLTEGYRVNLDELTKGSIFEEDYDEIIMLKDIELFSLCEHHLLPFYGKCHVGYLPKGRLIGMSKIPRVVDMFARRLQLQERLTTQIANTLNDLIKPMGVAVVVEAYHLCMAMRGVQKQHAFATTSCMLGAFRTHRETRQEFIALLKGDRSV
jgi:GTP cyclohydrolase I